MKRMLLTAVFACSLVMGALSMTGCNTIEGMGKDTQETGSVFTTGSPRDAYHQDARDF